MQRGVCHYARSGSIPYWPERNFAAVEMFNRRAYFELQRAVFGHTHDTTLKEDFGESDSDLEDDDDDDDDFLQKYRQQRLAEMKQEYSNNNKDHQTCSNKSNSKQQQQHRFGDVVPIQRPDWTFHVNDASHDATVVVVLTSKDNIELTGSVEAALSILAPLCPYIKFVTIPSTSAIDNFPDNNLPCAFI